jgi:ferredoxin
MNILLAYCSPNKTTEKLTHVLCDALSTHEHTVSLLNMASPNAAESPLLRDADVLGIGSPVYQLRLASPARRFLSAALPRLCHDASAFVYLTYGGISSGRAFENALRLLNLHHIGITGALKVCAPHSFSDKPFPDDDVQCIVKAFCQSLHEHQFAPIPFTEATQKLKCRSFLTKLVYPFADAVGKLRHLPVRIDADKCTACGRCVRDCPAAAISIDGKAVRKASACIHCYRCAAVCPVKAVVCPIDKLQDMVHMNKKLLGYEQPQNEILL